MTSDNERPGVRVGYAARDGACMLVVWGNGASTVDAVRTADSSAVDALEALHDAARWDSYASAKRAAGVEDGWAVVIEDSDIDADLDHDPATRGYCRVEIKSE